MVSPEVYHLLEDRGELGADCVVDLRKEVALHTGEHTVPGYAGHHVDVDWMLPNSGLRQTQNLGLSRARAVAHVHKHLLCAKQGRLHAVLVETRVLANVPKFLPKNVGIFNQTIFILLFASCLPPWLVDEIRCVLLDRTEGLGRLDEAEVRLPLGGVGDDVPGGGGDKLALLGDN